MNSPKVLIVDDSSIIRRILTKQLEEFGAQVTQAEDGRQGLEAALSQPFDLVISDVEMPHMDGFALCESLKSNSATRGLPVILLSSLDSDRDIERGFRAGASAYVSKSEAKEQLHETIRRVLEKASFHHDRRILVVDDSGTIRSLVKKGLENAGFMVQTAEDGLQALEIVKITPPDLILSDIDMPRMNGVELCKALHADPALAGIPFVIMSANAERAIMRRMLQWGASAYLVKPFNLDQLVITVEKLLSDHFRLLLKEKERLDTERRLMIASITSLIAALEARDQYTRGHSEAVSMIVAEMASRMQLSSEDKESLVIGGRLHDLGKIGVPDGILLKPGPLTREEFAVIREHPVVGANILGPIPSIRPLIPVILHHHERFDGKGYPHGLKGEKIPLWARMTAVADTYHALTSDRPYRKGMEHEKALEIIRDVRGTQLCPECADVFLEIFSEIPLEKALGSGQ
ncbi:MAG: response regulator [Deltaproteobacteria bacterium]|nr:response regulator [Deltaproteobacteria bacterium]MBW2017698.1 response regulator [Deltaproteobacteria bacterium]MBW2130370.1 response regulator [Deltaproteobacteria bacterium]MBW2303411.1 response regulator [Deltaproteobacteria bacterium]